MLKLTDFNHIWYSAMRGLKLFIGFVTDIQHQNDVRQVVSFS